VPKENPTSLESQIQDGAEVGDGATVRIGKCGSAKEIPNVVLKQDGAEVVGTVATAGVRIGRKRWQRTVICGGVEATSFFSLGPGLFPIFEFWGPLHPHFFNFGPRGIDLWWAIPRPLLLQRYHRNCYSMAVQANKHVSEANR
jgi:hypothetical protein